MTFLYIFIYIIYFIYFQKKGMLWAQKLYEPGLRILLISFCVLDEAYSGGAEKEDIPLIEQKAEQFWQVSTIIWVVSPTNLTKDTS